MVTTLPPSFVGKRFLHHRAVACPNTIPPIHSGIIKSCDSLRAIGRTVALEEALPRIHRANAKPGLAI